MKVVSLSALGSDRLYPTGNIHGTLFCWRLSRPQCHSAAGRIMSINNSNDNIGNRTRALPLVALSINLWLTAQLHHYPLCYCRCQQVLTAYLISLRSILILSTHQRLGLPSGLFPSGFPTKPLYTPSPHPYTPHAQPISIFSILSPSQYWVRITDHLAPRYAIFSIPPVTSSLLGPNILLNTLYRR